MRSTGYLAGRAHGWEYKFNASKAMNWTDARAWCQNLYTDMVVIQSQVENDYLVSLLPNQTQAPYYWIGITKIHKNDNWTWVGDNSTWISDQVWAYNEPNNNHSNEFCVELYVNNDVKKRGKWNDEKCSSRKYPVCYQAQCNQTSCNNRGRCLETINNTTCICDSSFEGDRCQTVVVAFRPLYGHLNCSDQRNAFNSTCHVGCSSGFLLLRSAEVTCSSDGNWHGLRPICIRGAHAWTYHYSINPLRSWNSAQKWCQQHYTDMVAIQNQGEITYLNWMLPFNPSYYWIGIRKVAGVWTWVGTNRSLMREAENWAVGEPNNAYEDCVEMYIKRDKDMAKWNDATCGKEKGTVCYTASCLEGSCGIHADCVETIGNFTCKCHPGFLSPSCEEAVTCDTLSDPEQGHLQCYDSYGPFHFNSTCQFHCDLGYHMEGPAWLQCQASGHWDHPAPVCQVEQCPALNQTTDRLLMTCNHPIAPSSYNSTCEFSCEEGFELSGQSWTECNLAVIACAPISPPAMGNMTCVNSLAPFSFGSSCSFNCLEGYTLASNSTLACLASGQWSQPRPTCTAMRCRALSAPPHGSLSCSNPHGAFSFSSRCALTCDEGFLHNGTAHTECSSLGTWSQEVPRCLAMRCRALSAPPHGSLSCSNPHGAFSFSSRCALTCDEGFLHNGTAHTECSSLGTWSQEVPRCLAMRCRALSAPPHGSLSCSNPHGAFSFSSRCALTCDEGFLHNGTAHTECSSLGTWSQEVPRCLAMRCRALSAPPHGSLSCSNPHGAFSFSSRCALTCDEGFLHNGTAHTECSSLGTWSQEVPRCLAMRCRALSAPPHGSLSCSNPHGAFSFSSRCALTCDEGFLHNGTAHTECSSLGTWSQEVPRCLAMRCRALSAPPHGSLSCSNPHGAFSFSSRCALTCDEGFLHNGTAHTECSSLGTWSQEVPRCLAMRCRALSAPPHGSLSCSNPHGAFSFSSRCALTCDEGFLHNGTAHTECSSLGTWSQEVPRCLAMRCRALSAPPHGSLSCSNPHGAFSFSSRCALTCDEGFLHNGTAHTECSSLGTWSQEVPRCLARSCPLLADAPHRGWMNCSHPYSSFSYGSHCDLGCSEGFWLRGTSGIACNTSGDWSREMPTCQVVQCEAGWLAGLPASPLSLNCSHPLGNFSFGTLCRFSCEGGYSLNGTEELHCSSNGLWSSALPTCAEEGMPLWSAALLYSAGTASSLVLLLSAVGLGLLAAKRRRKNATMTVRGEVGVLHGVEAVDWSEERGVPQGEALSVSQRTQNVPFQSVAIQTFWDK
ncbi:P-selectin [Merluccius polli]|uniref:E-selectin n=1 Tax=Merluccius polli TaxID=89951 RepID=A0AA47MVP1_MERPO|nr:P-selectin [Merluccius polli]